MKITVELTLEQAKRLTSLMRLNGYDIEDEARNLDLPSNGMTVERKTEAHAAAKADSQLLYRTADQIIANIHKQGEWK